ncbi:MAG: hypothetical protein AAF531_23230 [Actinomycetota bacterium]
MDSVTAARSLRGSVGMLAMAWLMDEATTRKAAERGMPTENNGAYAIGRLGVLGDCPVDDVVAAAYFWEPDLMRTMVASGRAGMSPAEGAVIYAQICREHGEELLGDFPHNERFGEVMAKVVAAADPAGAPTFAGWRDQALPEEPGPARTFQLAQTMRELRFGRHATAVDAAGMGPLEAILSGPAGEWNAEFFGWPKPYPDVSGLAESRDAIESETDRLHAMDLDVLTDEERADLRELAKAARAHQKEKAAA